MGEVGHVGATTVDAKVLELIVFNLSPINLIKLVKVVEPRVIFLSPKVDELGK